jgi:hypothetical protein
MQSQRVLLLFVDILVAAGIHQNPPKSAINKKDKMVVDRVKRVSYKRRPALESVFWF